MDIYDAFARSGSHTEIVACEYAGGDDCNLVADLAAMYDGEIDHVRDNDGTIDVWGFREDAPEGEMDWRLKVTLTN